MCLVMLSGSEYSKMSGPTATIFVVGPPPVILGPGPTSMVCPRCGYSIVTMVITEPTMMTHLTAILFCFMCCIPCAILPYCTPACQAKKHFCPVCQAYLGTYGRQL